MTAGTGATTCSCPPNYYGNPAFECKTCPVGYVRAGSSSAITRVTDCTELPKCAPGYFGTPGSCEKCPINTYRSGTAYIATTSANCTSCIEHASTNGFDGVTGIDGCVCEVGFAGSAVTGTCVACAAGTEKIFAGNGQCTIKQTGAANSEAAGTNTYILSDTIFYGIVGGAGAILLGLVATTIAALRSRKGQAAEGKQKLLPDTENQVESAFEKTDTQRLQNLSDSKRGKSGRTYPA